MAYCTNCGAEIKPDNAFCTNCGTTIKQTPTRKLLPAREDYFNGMRERLSAEGQEFVQGDAQIHTATGTLDVTVGFFRSPKRIGPGKAVYALVIMGDSSAITKSQVENFRNACSEVDYSFMAQWEVPEEYSFLREGRLTPGGLRAMTITAPICERIALLASAKVDEDAKAWIVENKFKIISELDVRIAGILDTSRSAIYLNKAPFMYSSYYNPIRKYITPDGM